MRYGPREYEFAEPFARALSENSSFRSWVLARTKFSELAHGARVLTEEMMARRTKGAQNWWRSHFTETCRCEGCRGQETDLLAIFEGRDGYRFALHVEVKQPTDKFPKNKDQARNYGLRAACWIGSTPARVVPHSDAATMLLCSSDKLNEFAPHIEKFDSFVTFEEASRHYP